MGVRLGVLFLIACDGVAPLSRSDIDKADIGATLAPGFLMGAATAAHQVEGGLDNDWTEWERGEGHIKNGDVSGAAADSWNRWPEDIAALTQLGANAYRVGLEWARIEPRDNAFDDEAIARYRQMLQGLRGAGIQPVVTLWHFTLPRWFADRGGFESDNGVVIFQRYVTRIARELGDVVDIWITINEPNVYALEGYGLGIWPPGVKDGKRQTRVFATLLRAHAAAATALRRTDTIDADGDGAATFIGLAHHVRVFQAASGSVLDQSVTGLSDDYFNESVPRALNTGKVFLTIPLTVTVDENVPDLRNSADFLGLNYYTRDHVRADLGDPTLSKQYVPDARPKSDLGWEIYPEGLLEMIMRFDRGGLPILITENGLADANDEQRPYFLRAHIYAIEKALKAGANVRGYLHWSLLDNFEWAEGYAPKFGLFDINRQARPSAQTFRGIADKLQR